MKSNAIFVVFYTLMSESDELLSSATHVHQCRCDRPVQQQYRTLVDTSFLTLTLNITLHLSLFDGPCYLFQIPVSVNGLSSCVTDHLNLTLVHSSSTSCSLCAKVQMHLIQSMRRVLKVSTCFAEQHGRWGEFEGCMDTVTSRHSYQECM